MIGKIKVDNQMESTHLKLHKGTNKIIFSRVSVSLY